MEGTTRETPRVSALGDRDHRSTVVPRRALFELLSAGADGGVTLVCAPAGSGKTILLRSWIEEAGLTERAAWVSVERGEQDAQRFWLSIIERLRSAVGPDAFVETLAPTPGFDGEAVVERLVSELGSLDEPVVLVIDDLQELASVDALAQLERLIAQRPRLLRVVLATRRDPQLGLHRVRVAGELTEIRAADLRFTVDETSELLAVAGIVLADQSVAVLVSRTEGWAAGLRLAALSLVGHTDPERFVDEFSGSERTVADYLLAEVLERQPDDVRRLLLRTSILDRVNGELADVLTEASGSELVLNGLAQANAFVTALDTGRTWFRYHSLFAELLRFELRRRASHLVFELHRSAAAWWLRHGFPIEATRHAQAAEDWPYAARVLADHGFSLCLHGQGATVAALLGAFPVDVRADPELVLLSSNEPLQRGRLDEAEALLNLAERDASAVPPEQRHAFEVKLTAGRLVLARRRGDFESVLGQIQTLRGLLDAQPPRDFALADEVRTVALMNLGIVELWSFMTAESELHLERGLELARELRIPYVEVGCLSHLSVIAATRRTYALARELSQDAIAVADAHGWAAEAVVGIAPLELATLDVLQGRFDDAHAWHERAEQALLGGVDPAAELLLYLLRGWLFLVDGRHDDALEPFRAGEQHQRLVVAPQQLSAPARFFLVQTLLRIGDTAGAHATLADVSGADRDWADSRCAFAALHIADGDAEAALEVLSPVLDRSAPGSKLSTVFGFLLDAFARDLLGDVAAADKSIECALEFAEPDGIIFPFVVTPSEELLRRHARHTTAHAALLSDILDVLSGSSLSAPAGSRPELREDLTESELRVLRYLPSNLSAPEIGRELYLSLSTIKTHMRHIYAKLGVHHRTEAVERARQLRLLAPTIGRR